MLDENFPRDIISPLFVHHQLLPIQTYTLLLIQIVDTIDISLSLVAVLGRVPSTTV